MMLFRKAPRMPTLETALKGRPDPIPTATHHFVNGRPLLDLPEGMEVVLLGMGCFWGAERLFWQMPGVHVTAVGYAGGFTPNPTYREVCSGQTGHAEVVRVVYDLAELSFETILDTFFTRHDPTQGMRQGNDVGTQYRSCLYGFTQDQVKAALTAKAMYEAKASAPITTEIAPAEAFYLAEAEHQQYLAKNPQGYCGLQ